MISWCGPCTQQTVCLSLSRVSAPPPNHILSNKQTNKIFKEKKTFAERSQPFNWVHCLLVFFLLILFQIKYYIWKIHEISCRLLKFVYLRIFEKSQAWTVWVFFFFFLSLFQNVPRLHWEILPRILNVWISWSGKNGKAKASDLTKKPVTSRVPCLLNFTWNIKFVKSKVILI